MYYILHPNSPSPRKHNNMEKQKEQEVGQQENFEVYQQLRAPELNTNIANNSVQTIKDCHQKFLDVKQTKHKTEQELKALQQKVSKLQKENEISIVEIQPKQKPKVFQKSTPKQPLQQNTSLLNQRKADKIRKESHFLQKQIQYQKANMLDQKLQKSYQIKQTEKNLQQQKQKKEFEREQKCLQDYKKKISAEEEKQRSLENEIKKLRLIEQKFSQIPTNSEQDN